MIVARLALDFLVARLLSIGEFSKATALTIKTLRHYHERGLLLPSSIDPQSGYRYYGEDRLERAHLIKALRALEFSLDEIVQILEACEDDADALEFLEHRKAEIEGQLARLGKLQRTLDQIIETERDARAHFARQGEIEEKEIPELLIAGVRLRGAFQKSKEGFGKLGRHFGMQLAGKPSMLIYDEDYREDDADFEVLFPIKRVKPEPAGVSVRTLEGGTCLSLVHQGPYDRISRTYARLFQAMRTRSLQPLVPSREVYIKGPGMLFKGNPQRYLTEVQIFVSSDRSQPQLQDR